MRRFEAYFILFGFIVMFDLFDLAILIAYLLSTSSSRLAVTSSVIRVDLIFSFEVTSSWSLGRPVLMTYDRVKKNGQRT